MHADSRDVPEWQRNSPSAGADWLDQAAAEFDGLMEELGSELVEGGETSITMLSETDDDQRAERQA